MQGMKTSIHLVGARLDVALLTIAGYIDTTTCQELAKIIQDLFKQKRYLVVADLGAVSYISSAGWGVFVGEIKNIREKGGDLKIAQMTPEVTEVFEMLEFNSILNYFESVEEAIDEFDILRGIDIGKSSQQAVKVNKSTTLPVSLPKVKIKSKKDPLSQSKSHNDVFEPSSARSLPLMEKIKRIVIENPFGGARYIAKQLNTEQYGSIRIGFFRMWSILKKLNLENREKRYRFYRSR